ncbi:alpha-1A adrenergic receptor-like [Acanthaster planci]|uniref:Alpha-1A adrenergic receptor-like n=1 Tax=Acanthaster planci TaxID=133434 RepID=A0A8B7ZVP3_ACAPL|nr:alpha-1A adrenergic receptor-like [Acanthaster planci]
MADPLLVRIINTSLGVIGLIGNSIVVSVIFKVKFMHTLTNALICNQAVVDLLGSLFLILTSNIAVSGPLLGTSGYHIVCHLWLSKFFVWSCFTASTVNLVSLTCERYVAIVYPFKYVTLYTRKSVAGMVVVTWLMGLILGVAYAAAGMTFENGQCSSTTSVGAQALNIILVVVQFFIPAILMVFLYSHMTVTLKRSAERIAAIAPTVSANLAQEDRDSSGATRSENAEQSLLRARRNVFKTLLLVFVTFLVCWMPAEVMFTMFNFGIDLSGVMHVVSVSLVATNSCVNPFIYALKYTPFQRGFLSLIGRKVQAEVGML